MGAKEYFQFVAKEIIIFESKEYFLGLECKNCFLSLSGKNFLNFKHKEIGKNFHIEFECKEIFRFECKEIFRFECKEIVDLNVKKFS